MFNEKLYFLDSPEFQRFTYKLDVSVKTPHVLFWRNCVINRDFRWIICEGFTEVESLHL